MTTLATTNYEQQAADFLAQTETTLTVNYLKTGKYFDDDKDERDIYKCELKRGNRSYKFNFGQSIADSGFYYQYKSNKRQFPLDRKWLDKDYFKGKSLGLTGTIKMKDGCFTPHLDTIHYPIAPTAYSILSCLTKYDCGSFEDFCNEFGYDTDSKKAEKTYNAVKDEYMNVCALFTDKEIEQLQEIN
jgi:hypothetical protein